MTQVVALEEYNPLPMMKITPRAQQILDLARVEADRQGAELIERKHLLLAILLLSRGVVHAVLKNRRVDFDKAIAELSRLVAPDEPTIPNQPRLLDEILAKAEEEVKGLQDEAIGTVHLLLAVLSKADSPEAQIFLEWSVTPETVRAAIKELISVEAKAPSTNTDRTEPTQEELLKLSEEASTAARHNWPPPLTSEATSSVDIVRRLARQFLDQSLGLLFLLSFLILAQAPSIKNLLLKKGVDLAKLKRAIEDLLQDQAVSTLPVESSVQVTEMPNQPPISKVVRRAVEIADERSHTHTGIGHLFLVILEDEAVISILSDHGMEANETYQALYKILDLNYRIKAKAPKPPERSGALPRSLYNPANQRRDSQKSESEQQPSLHPHFEKALEFAIDEAKRLQSAQLNSCHFLLGVISVPCGLASELLENMGVDLEKLRELLLKVIVIGGNSSTETDFVEQKVNCTALARWESYSFRHPCVDDTHLLLAVLGREQHVGVQVLESIGINYERVRNAVLELELEKQLHLPLLPDVELVVMLAQKQASRMGHDLFSSAHILYALTELKKSLVVELLKQTVDMLEFRSALKELLATQCSGAGNWDQILRLAMQEAWMQHRSHVGVEQLLVAILRIKDCPAADLLKRWDLPCQRVREALAAFELSQEGKKVSKTYQKSNPVIALGEKANAAVDLAVRLALRQDRRWVGCEHLLIAAICLGSGETISALREHFSKEIVRAGELVSNPGEMNMFTNLPMTQNFYLTCKAAREQAGADGQHTVDIRYLLLALFRNLDFRENLTKMGIDLIDVLPKLIQELWLSKPDS